MEMADRIKQRRLAMGYTQEELAEKLGLQKSAIAKYENGRVENIKRSVISNMATVLECSPTYIMGWDEDYYLGENLQNIFETLSKEFSIPTNELIRCFFSEDFTDLLPSKKVITLNNMRNALKTYFASHTDDNVLTLDECKHITQYRTLDSHGKDMVDTVLNKEAERISEQKTAPSTVIDIHSRLDDDSRLVEYFHGASAGTGIFILGNEANDQLAIPNTLENRKVDYAIKVSGVSMEPDYHDGDIVLVSQKVALNHGDVGIFIINNDAYIKEYGKTELISRNPDADNIRIAEYDNIVCMGKVIGKYQQ